MVFSVVLECGVCDIVGALAAYTARMQFWYHCTNGTNMNKMMSVFKVDHSVLAKTGPHSSLKIRFVPILNAP